MVSGNDSAEFNAYPVFGNAVSPDGQHLLDVSFMVQTCFGKMGNFFFDVQAIETS